MHQPCRVTAVFSKAARNVAAKGSNVGAKMWLAAHAVKTREAGLQGVSDDAGAKCEVGDVATEGGDCTGCFVAC